MKDTPIEQTKSRKDGGSLSTHIEQNVRTIACLEKHAMAQRSSADRLSDAITRVAGSATCVGLHAIAFTIWIAVNVGLVPDVTPFDPYPFSFLTLVVSLEAIFLAISVLMSQNRAARLADRRAHLDLQIDLLAERELTAALHMLRALCAKQQVVLDKVGTDVKDLLEETNVEKLVSDLDKKLPA
jgi:uncharacterized membrane protein